MLFSVSICVRISLVVAIAFLGLSDPLLAQASKSPPSKKKAMQRERARQEAGSIDGAIWAFQLTPSKGGPAREKLRGRYRISDLVVYQAEEPDVGHSRSRIRRGSFAYETCVSRCLSV
jgi:hypothetical protein